ncbi:glucuronate isomerase [Prodigiosinella confusarubida]|uniref:Uronate isomerase n=1 Tax=Serratia sp. (strain ATCC 39006) TaxID=104623 RepID=A0A2I5TBS3_SERS3|nr:glucuronate isomerase [Serratia sp. ATCC 39006]AUH02028.1 glucuronate isomerase [Serratia sp. ATCC 39006]AUH06350.1 glucuronate isomerase [Serratia sp. ATCC 39006]
MAFIGKDFILNNETARKLYHDVAEHQPIIDYHCHLDPKVIAEDRPFADITALWLAGDHYKWRAMRANGIPEEKITGNATAIEKFQAWAETVESCIGNPLYHWTHLELKFYFGITETLNSHNWKSVWEKCNELLRSPAFSPRGLIKKSNVETICTTDAPTDSLEYHDILRADKTFTTQVLPTFRPDEALDGHGDTFIQFIGRLEQLNNKTITHFQDFLDALDQRVAYFHQKGGRLSDHGLTKLEFMLSDEKEQEALFAKKRQGLALSHDDDARYKSAVLLSLAASYAKRDWAMQIHFGASRNNNSRMFKQLGANVGYDSICDQTDVASNINGLLDAMSRNDALPKVIFYNLDPTYNDVVASSLANFQAAGAVKSRMQLGAGWWFNDTKRGMIRQLTALADHGLLVNFVGMLTDSRSFISYTRHEYFRRILCNLVGQWVTDGEIPDDNELLTRLIKNICYQNARDYFNF